MNEILDLKNSGIFVSVNMFCHQRNFKELKDLFDFAEKNNLNSINLVSVVLIGRTLKNKVNVKICYCETGIREHFL